jgi:hypothetical protein
MHVIPPIDPSINLYAGLGLNFQGNQPQTKQVREKLNVHTQQLFTCEKEVHQLD